MASIMRVLLLAVIAILACTLHGCGCNEDKLKECATKQASATPGTDGCGSIAALTECYSDKSCCDYEKDGAKMKDAINVMVAALKALGKDCTSKNKC